MQLVKSSPPNYRSGRGEKILKISMPNPNRNPNPTHNHIHPALARVSDVCVLGAWSFSGRSAITLPARFAKMKNPDKHGLGTEGTPYSPLAGGGICCHTDTPTRRLPDSP